MSCIVTLAIVGIGLLLNWSKSSMGEAVIEATLREMKQIGAQVEQQFEQTLQENYEDLSTLAEYIVRYQVPFDEIGAFLTMQSQTEAFDTLYYIDLEGNGVSLTGEQENFSGNLSFEYALQNECLFTEPQVFVEPKEMVFDVAAPVIENGQTIAVAFGPPCKQALRAAETCS